MINKFKLLLKIIKIQSQFNYFVNFVLYVESDREGKKFMAFCFSKNVEN